MEYNGKIELRIKGENSIGESLEVEKPFKTSVSELYVSTPNTQDKQLNEEEFILLMISEVQCVVAGTAEEAALLSS